MATLTFDRLALVMTVAAPDTEVTVQEIYDQCRLYEVLSSEMDDPPLVSAGGKENLGRGNSVAVTLTLLNGWRLAFAARAGPGEVSCFVSGGNIVREDPFTGTATTADPPQATMLIDSTATFLTDGVRQGDIVTNTSDGSSAQVLTVDSDTQLTHGLLEDGSNNDWEIGDVYQVVATNPIVPTAFVQVVISQATAPVSIATATEDFVHALVEHSLDGVIIGDILEDILAMASGRVVEGPTGTFNFYERDNTTVRYTLVKSGSERTRS